MAEIGHSEKLSVNCFCIFDSFAVYIFLSAGMLQKGSRFYLLLILCFMVCTASGQPDDTIRTLEKSLTEKLPDTVRLNTLIRLSELCMTNKKMANKSEVYINKAFELASEKKLVVPYKLRWLHARVLQTLEMHKKAVAEMEMVIKYLDEQKNYQEAAEARNYLANILFFSGQFNESIESYLQNANLARERKLKKVIPEAYLGIANVYGQTQNNAEREKFLQLFLDAGKSENNPALTAQASFRIGVHKMSVDSNLKTAIPFLHDALSIQKSSTILSQH